MEAYEVSDKIGLAVPQGGRRHGGEDFGCGDRGSYGLTMDLHNLPEKPDGDYDDEPPSG